MKVAILYICTGKYNYFFKGFYESCEKYFLKDIAEVRYFVFTDDEKLTDAENVKTIKKVCKGFPMDSLLRFDMFMSLENELEDFDYTFFFNANMEFVSPVGKEILPEKDGLAAVVHPGFFNKPSFMYPYERNKKSAAYIKPRDKEYTYFMGSLNGGKTKDYMALAKTCSENTHNDPDHGIIALVHDESHLNKYLHDKPCLKLSPAYAYPEGWKLPFEPKIIIRDKTKISQYFNKGRDHSIIGRLKKASRILYRAIIWNF